MEDWQYIGILSAIYIATGFPTKWKAGLLIGGVLLFALQLYEMYLIGKF